MKVCIIYGNQRRESTYNCVRLFKEALQKNNEVEFKEFILPKDMPHLCLGCFRCFTQGEDTCPHAEWVQPIAKTMLESDGIVFASPVYACDAAASIKALYDHLCYMWLPHRPQKEMFSKIVMTITTTAGMGVRSSLKTLKKSPSFWGVKRVYGFGMAVSSASWREIPEKKRSKLEKALFRKAEQFAYAVNNHEKLHTKLKTKFLVNLMGKMVRKYDPDNMLYRDKQHWLKNGWLDGKRPWKEAF